MNARPACMLRPLVLVATVVAIAAGLLAQAPDASASASNNTFWATNTARTTGTPPAYPNRAANWTVLDARATAASILGLGLPYTTDESRGEDCSSFVSHVWGYDRRYTSDVIATGQAPATTVLGPVQAALPAQVREDPTDPYYLTAFSKGPIGPTGHVGLIVRRDPGSNTVFTIESTRSGGGPRPGQHDISYFAGYTLVRRDFAQMPESIMSADMNHDGHADMVAKDAAGNLFWYRSTGAVSGAPTLQGRVQIGTGWNMY